MPRNRVEKLESTVRELESTVSGLTEELVESKERIRVLEGMLQAEPETRIPPRRPVGRREAKPDEVEEATAVAAAAVADGEAVDEATDDATDDADADESVGDEETEPQSSGIDDIIVA